ncbi:MAG: hypothetical protein WBR26_01190 [Candidatus Acidiferrum sp.]
MPRPNYTDQQLLDYSEEHLMYELNILQWLVEEIPKTSESFQLSAYLESFTVHLRALTDFLYPPQANPQADDLVAGHFFDAANPWNPGPVPQKLEGARTRMNKEVAHITYKRKAGMDPDKPWPVTELFKEILPVLKTFATTASAQKLHAKVIAWAKADAGKMVIVAVNASTQSTNTAAVVISNTVVSPTPETKNP